ncbi:MBL fold metallo-hydrolase [Gordonia sp. (in: high G+C Gram-positive bacteria)]|jgi:L-ascorbate metabolism protein UlaG (beta-lactamase superfamily)|uniref:MBL fold metallo-hydrolase n=1 Tax=Gordonia sp. (in: high G+C Gram-positive bacteria) TaxID=84139 RepID=UPI001D2877C3|nr:MBL fold metallo-hydrolase [Gordonia sp. (in: high G+C Gram-positive bacteria)]MCB1295509.1 MBL fold metallo-hydrolase [Gordonia sp. (in: high G+C Gram-positive bacteria)]HMS74606.1 MBL fold metallo-hydrolase [Gordonia sp. (in: high G+C Gram-positive bacteria)]
MKASPAPNAASAVARRAASATRDAADGAATRLAGAGVPVLRALGAGREQIRPHVEGSPHLRHGRFANAEQPSPPVETDGSVLREMLRRPGKPVRPVRVLTPAFTAPGFDDDRADLAATWLGHATVLVELDGVRILTDPVLSKRCSPSELVGPARLHPAPASVATLPAVDIVLISHDHYDHLDYETITAIAAARPEVTFVAPVGVGAHLLAWGIAADRIRQADWGQAVTSTTARGGSLTFTCCPARHFSGRFLDRNLTQWASWAVRGPSHSFFFSGDTGFTERFADTGASSGPFDLTLIAIGAYDPLWPDIHLNPEEAIAVHRMLSGSSVGDAVMMPIHWGTFNLARHTWADPVRRVLESARDNTATVLIPPPGGRIDLVGRTGDGLTDPAWWERSA